MAGHLKHGALASLAALLALGLVALRAGEARTLESRAPAAGTVRASAPQRAIASEPVRLEPVADARPSVVAAAPAEPAAPSARPERAAHAVHELAALLVAEPFDRLGLVRAAEALARPLSPQEGEALVAGLGRQEDPLTWRLAACELLRALDPRPGTLPDALGAELRALARQSGLAALPESAAHALVALGGTADVRHVIALLGDLDPTVRSRCARALAGAAGLPEPARLALALELELALAQAPERPATQAIERALCALRPRAEEPEARARALLAPATSDAERLLAAADLARDPRALAPEAHAAARALLETRAASGSPSERRRALYALGTLADRDTLPTLIQAARSDPDPTARSAGVRALRDFEARATLEAVAASDPSPAVRALAAQELGRSAPDQSPGPSGGAAGVSAAPGSAATGSITKSVLAGPIRSPRR